MTKWTMTKWGYSVVIALLVAGCGGGGVGQPGGGGGQPPGMPPPPVETSSAILFSDLLFRESGATNEERVTDIACTADLAACTATFRGINQTFTADPNAEDDGTAGTAYTSLGDWAHMQPIVVDVAAEGLEVRLAVVAGPQVATRFPAAVGSATWTGTMVALDPEKRLVRGGATLTIPDLATPAVDVELTPQGRAAMTWDALSVTGGRFSARDSASNYLRGAFYGPAAQEAGGVFERNRLIGAFGATRLPGTSDATTGGLPGSPFP